MSTIDNAGTARAILGNIEPVEMTNPETGNWLALAQVHATLAHTAAVEAQAAQQARSAQVLGVILSAGLSNAQLATVAHQLDRAGLS